MRDNKARSWSSLALAAVFFYAARNEHGITQVVTYITSGWFGVMFLWHAYADLSKGGR